MSTTRIYTTRDYFKFELLTTNRPVTNATINLKVKEIKRKNLLSDFPILVRERKGKFQIFDGQNRFEAARKLGLPIFYKISATIEPEDVPLVNNAQTKWKGYDYLACHVASGNRNYDQLQEFIEDTKIPLAIAVGLLGGEEKFNELNRAFRLGEFKVADPLHAKKVASIITIFRQYVPWGARRSLVLAISRIIKASKIDATRVSQKLAARPGCIHKCADWIQYVELIDAMYNYRVRGEDIVPIREDVRKWMIQNRPNDTK